MSLKQIQGGGEGKYNILQYVTLILRSIYMYIFIPLLPHLTIFGQEDDCLYIYTKNNFEVPYNYANFAAIQGSQLIAFLSFFIDQLKCLVFYLFLIMNYDQYTRPNDKLPSAG